VLRTPVLAGRGFRDADMQPSAAKIAIVNERFVREFGLGVDAVSRRFWIETTPLEPRAVYEIVGVVGDTKYGNLREADPPMAYVPLWPAAFRRSSGQFLIRQATAADDSVSAARTALDDFGGTRYALRSYTAIIDDGLLRERLMAALADPFSGLALILTAVGLYGVFSYRTAQRTKEIGIKMALGASARDIVASFLAEAGIVLLPGLLAGAALAVIGGRAVEALLFGITPYDPVSLALAVAVLTLISTAATFVPARRAAKTNPAVTLRHD
jgi:hypothetical protein